MDRQVAITAEGIIGKVLAIDCRDREGCWIEYIRPNQGLGIWRNGVEILKTREGKKELGGKIKSSAELEGVMMPRRSKEKVKIREEASDSCSLSGKRVNRFMKENVGKLRNRRKKHKGDVVHIKPDRGLFTWNNNREERRLVKERLDKFLISANWFGWVLFLPSKVIRQASSDYDAILLDTWGRKPKEDIRDLRILSSFEAC
ncbi:hypothetical protein Gorai_006083 [Gossypium raimondii]|uniref:Uncharacterized protein n=1 Tax=Gossypium raimondii TaxID=29730 RepID=A0A7J8QF16_GOSRA|nr:hypothetical protein [Gossypium raimondii]